MILKEAFRYQNYLKTLQNDIYVHLRNRDNVVKNTETHYYSKSNNDKNDEEIVTVGKIEPNKLIELIKEVIAEKIAVTNAISKAKKSCEYDIDALLETNKFMNNFVDCLKGLNVIESKETKTTGLDYKFNLNGEQLSYKYPVTTVSTINFDRNETRKMANKYSKQITDTSNLIDEINVTLKVDFEPKFDINDTVEDILNKDSESESES